jgi:hypothetical protein
VIGDDVPDMGALFTVSRMDGDTLSRITRRFPKSKFRRLADMLKCNFLRVDNPTPENHLNRIALCILKRTFDETVSLRDIVQGKESRNGFGF